LALLACAPTPTSRADGGGDTGGAITYTTHVQPILMAKCSPCHSTQNLGNHNLATTYADAHTHVESFDSFGCWSGPNMDIPTTVGECALILSMNGRMPMGFGCGSPTPIDPAKCVSTDEQAVIAAWIAAGMPQ
jgi:hypothetical protein